MKLSRVARQLRYCHDNPDQYKLCQNQICVPVNRECPCDYEEFQCLDGRCLHPGLLCNGRDDCNQGEDETFCASQRMSEQMEELPGAVVAGIVVSVIVVVTVVAVFVIVLIRRHRSQVRQQDTVSEPLQTGPSQSSDPSNETEQTISENVGFRSTQKHDSFANDSLHFDEALCTSTPRSDIRRQIHPGSERPGVTKASILMNVS